MGEYDQKRADIIQKMWLTYYNESLYEKGYITKEERDRMCQKIKSGETPCEK